MSSSLATDARRSAWVVALATLAVLALPGSRVAAQPTDAAGLLAMSQRGPEAAPITILEFSDFACPYCARMPAVVDELVKKYPTQVRVVFKHIPLPIHPQAPMAHEAALAAGEQGKFWEMHDLLFANQSKLDRESLLRYAAQLGLRYDQFARALDSHTYRAVVARDLAEASGLGVNATPTFFIAGQRMVGAQSLQAMQAVVERLLNPGQAAPGMTAGPAVVSPGSINLEHAPVRGPSSAPITIVEYSDLLCPFCSRANPVLSEVLSRYPGQVRLVFKNFPLDMHVNAPLAHRAALAANEQGQFWKMHDALFARQDQATPDGVRSIARQVGLDMTRFEADLASDRVNATIDRDKREGERLGIDGTPTFFINGVRLVGARPFADFASVIDRELLKTPAALRSDLETDPALAGASASRQLGTKDAAVTVTWFGDLRNPINGEASQLIRQLATSYGSKVHVVFKHSPLKNRQESVLAYDAALAAGAQNRFWEMEDLIDSNQSAGTIEAFVSLARQLKLDVVKFERDLRDRTFKRIAEADRDDADRQGVRGTPTFFVGAERIDGIVLLETLKKAVDGQLSRDASTAAQRNP